MGASVNHQRRLAGGVLLLAAAWGGLRARPAAEARASSLDRDDLPYHADPDLRPYWRHGLADNSRASAVTLGCTVSLREISSVLTEPSLPRTACSDSRPRSV